jgi:hypothetical protein
MIEPDLLDVALALVRLLQVVRQPARVLVQPGVQRDLGLGPARADTRDQNANRNYWTSSITGTFQKCYYTVNIEKSLQIQTGLVSFNLFRTKKKDWYIWHLIVIQSDP